MSRLFVVLCVLLGVCVDMIELFAIADDTLSMSPLIPVFHKQSFFRQPDAESYFVCTSIETFIFNYTMMINIVVLS